MKKKTLLITCLLLAALLAGAGMLYNNLSDRVQTGGLVTNPPETEMSMEAPTDTPTEAATQAPSEPPATTQPQNLAPDFTMLDGSGNEVQLSDFFGKPIVLNFWASWCGPCKSEMPQIQEFYGQYGEEIHFLLVSVDDSVEDAKAFIEDAGYTFPVYFDTTYVGAYTYGASSIPLTFFIHPDGQLAAYYMGAMSEGILQQGVDLIYTPAEAE